MTTDDLALINATRGDSMSPYEHFMMSEKTSKRPSGTAIAGLVLGSVGAAVGIGAWIFGGVYSASRANANMSLINANAEHSRQMENLLATTLTNERAERINSAPSFTDYVNVSQQGSQTASASSNAVAQAEATLFTQALTGQMQTCPQKVSIYSAPQPCACPGCNG